MKMWKIILGIFGLLGGLFAVNSKKSKEVQRLKKVIDDNKKEEKKVAKEIEKLEKFENTLDQVLRSEAILRVKGYLSVKGKPMRLLVQAVGERVRTQYDKAWGESKRSSKLVIIAEKDDLNEKKIREQFSHFN